MPREKRKRSDDNAAKRTSASGEEASPEHDYYNRLVYQCRKDLSKQLKVCKSFECQKLIRKVKATDNDQQSAKLQEAYELLKELPMELVVVECCRRLGVLQLNPSGYEPPQNTEALDGKWVEKLLEHKRMQQSIEKWSEQATEFRKWCLKRQERDNDEERAGTKKTSKRDKSGRHAESDQGDVSSSLFVQLGDSKPNATFAAPKKNRTGQRARKAKAAAIHAKEKGLPAPEKSLNWRASKPPALGGAYESQNHPFNAGHHEQHVKAGRDQHSVPQDKSNTEEKLHPSWVAQKSKKDGIVAFQGKKITFD